MDERLKRDLVDRPASVATRLELVGYLNEIERRIEALEAHKEPGFPAPSPGRCGDGIN
ncbi:hypothetical protein LCGC14_1179550 [marine sediment metagenome]|uniref:Uncharacterized protein n=1 Tax=marine sediment metagenome TaxID=412755 RepID=A0A0F9MAE4_9ZZZZ